MIPVGHSCGRASAATPSAGKQDSAGRRTRARREGQVPGARPLMSIGDVSWGARSDPATGPRRRGAELLNWIIGRIGGSAAGLTPSGQASPERGQVGRAHPTRHSRPPHNLRTCRDQRIHADVRTCGPGRVRIASGENDNHFAGCASLTDMCKRGGNIVEREGAVDVDPDVPGNA